MLSLILLTCLVAAGSPVFSKITHIVNFGDSTSDTGNGAALLTKDNGPIIPQKDTYWNGRFSNGPVYIEHVATELNLNLVSYAVGGATTTDRLAKGWLGGKFGEPVRTDGSVVYVPSVETQVDQYLGSRPLVITNVTHQPVPYSEILFTVWSGGNDEFDIKLKHLNYSGSMIADAHFSIWEKLAHAGAKHILAVVPPPQSLFSFALGTKMEVNALEFRFLYPSVRLALLQLPILFVAVKMHPEWYGLKYTTGSCCKNCSAGLDHGATVCDRPDDYMLWDDFHPSNRTHAIIAQKAASVIRSHFDV